MRKSVLIDYFTYILMKILGWIASLLPPKFRGHMGMYIGNLLFFISSKRKKIAFHNLRIAFPDKSFDELKKIARKSFQNLSIVFIETAAADFFSEKDIIKLVKINNIELVFQLLSQNKGLIFLSAHYGNWEYAAIAAGIYSKVPINVIVQKQKNKFVNKSITQTRTKFGNNVVPMNNAARQIIQAIRKNEAIAMLVDQSAKFGKDNFIDFFATPALTYDAPAEIALRFRTPIVYGFAFRNVDFTYTIELNELDFSDLSYSKENIKILTRRHVEVLEKQILKAPELWVWEHKRWKHSVDYKKIG
ncbi:MAG: lysophospholipid acyltransferase family protein [Ignavibacteria bacterium]|nr:lysophospholipid acyltransferase family protein [Ignavibacteria bacterium]